MSEHNAILALLINRAVDSRRPPSVSLSLDIEHGGFFSVELTSEQFTHILAGLQCRVVCNIVDEQ